MGGHNVLDDTIRRRYHAGLKNFFRLYRPIADTWRIYDNSQSGAPRLISSGEYDIMENVTDVVLWETLKREYHG
jgi:predicted ABC-type ATPase